MIIFISSILYTIQLVLQNCNCLNLIDLQQVGAGHSPKWKLETRRTPPIYQHGMVRTLPRKREIKFRNWQGIKKPHNKIFFKRSRRVYEDERDANLKNKISTLVKQTMTGIEEVMKDAEVFKASYKEDQGYKAGFVLSMLKKSREVVNELFNVAIKHRDEWLALEQLKIFEMIVNTNIDTTNLLKQLIEIKGSGGGAPGGGGGGGPGGGPGGGGGGGPGGGGGGGPGGGGPGGPGDGGPGGEGPAGNGSDSGGGPGGGGLAGNGSEGGGVPGDGGGGPGGAGRVGGDYGLGGGGGRVGGGYGPVGGGYGPVSGGYGPVGGGYGPVGGGYGPDGHGGGGGDRGGNMDNMNKGDNTFMRLQPQL